jgi:alginate O-acetyltransferase complex protein AlgF
MSASVIQTGMLRAVVTVFALFAGAILPVAAQSTGRLYDPEPPPDSGYVRLILTGKSAPVSVMVDDKLRIKKLEAHEMSEYMVLKEGHHKIALVVGEKAAKTEGRSIDVVRGKSVTLALAGTSHTDTMIGFDDKGNTNKLKAMLTFYHLDNKQGALDVTTADGGTKVFSAVEFGKSSSLQVNPIKVELMTVAAGAKSTAAKATLEMDPGATYSAYAVSIAGKPSLKVTGSKVERYIGN